MARPESHEAESYRAIARRLSAKLTAAPAGPRIIVE